MDIRSLRYFTEIVSKGSVTEAAEALSLSQPALSRQMKELEDELGKKLFVRGKEGLTPTSDGLLLFHRAKDILSLVNQAEEEIKTNDSLKGGDVYLGCAETHLISNLASTIKSFRERYPLFRFHIVSGDRTVVMDRLSRGLLDFGIVVDAPDPKHYECLEIPGANKWGVLLKSDHPLAKKEFIEVDDLIGEELIASEQSIKLDIPRWCGKRASKLNFIGTSNLAYNGSVFVKEGLGLLLCFDRLVNAGKESGLAFVPLKPALESKIYLTWRKGQAMTPIAEKPLEEFQNKNMSFSLSE